MLEAPGPVPERVVLEEPGEGQLELALRNFAALDSYSELVLVRELEVVEVEPDPDCMRVLAAVADRLAVVDLHLDSPVVDLHLDSLVVLDIRPAMDHPHIHHHPLEDLQRMLPMVVDLMKEKRQRWVVDMMEPAEEYKWVSVDKPVFVGMHILLHHHHHHQRRWH